MTDKEQLNNTHICSMHTHMQSCGGIISIKYVYSCFLTVRGMEREKGESMQDTGSQSQEKAFSFYKQCTW